MTFLFGYVLVGWLILYVGIKGLVDALYPEYTKLEMLGCAILFSFLWGPVLIWLAFFDKGNHG
jgi:hypothetical protein